MRGELPKVYLALTRPKLKRGAEWKLATLNGLLALLMLVTALWHWLDLGGRGLVLLAGPMAVAAGGET